MSTTPLRSGWPPEWPIPPTPPHPTPQPAHVPTVLPAWPGRAPEPDDWLSQRLYDNRIVLVRGTIDRDAATRLTAQLLALDAASARPVRLQFDAPAADITAALLLADTLELLRVTSHGVVIREVGGGALAILAATTHRSALRHARLRLSEPRPDADLRHYADESEAAQQHAKLLAEFVDRLAQTTHRSTDEIAADLRGRRYLTATAAIEYRLIHEIAHPESTD